MLAAAPAEQAAPAENENEPAKTDAGTNPADAEDDEKLLDAQALVEDTRNAILPISIDDNGLYELLKKKAA